MAKDYKKVKILPIFFIYYFIVFFHALFCNANTEEQIPKVKIQSSIEGAELKAVKWPYKIKPYWKKNTDGGIEFFWALQLQVPGKIGISNIQAQKSKIGIKDENTKPTENPKTTNEQTIFVGLKSISDQLLVTLKDNSHIEINIQLVFQNPIIIEQECEELNLKLSPISKPIVTNTANGDNGKTQENNKKPKKKSSSDGLNEIPFYLAYKCEVIPTGIRLAVTSPVEMPWVSNSLFETKGKGENWKNFDLGVQLNSLNKQEVGTIEFEWNNTHYPFQILVEKTEIIRPISAFVFSFGLINISLKTNSAQQALTKASALVSFEIRPLSPNFSLGGQGMTSIPSVDPNSYFNHTEIMGYLGYTTLERKNWYLEPRGYAYIVNGVVKTINYFYISSNFALGGIVRYNFNPRNQISFESLFMSYNSQSIFSARAMYSRKNRNQVGGWGLSFVYQTLGMNLQSKDKSLGSQIYFGPYLEF